MKYKKLAKNISAPLIYQITAIICGFIIPRFLLQAYGSEINGLVNSINQFLHFIVFLEMGIGAVVRSSLYKPLAEKNTIQISKVIKSANKYFNKIALVLSVYIVFLIIFFPNLAENDYGYVYTATLILAMSISSFAQYFFGLTDSILLMADQRGYLTHNAQTITLISNTIISVILIKLNASIQLVKLISSLIFLIKPIYLRLYINKHYTIDRKIKYTDEPIAQKWNGIAQHISSVVLDGTDIAVLTIFASFSDVSIYSTYHLVVHGLKNLFLALTSGIQSFIGELWATAKFQELTAFFNKVEWIIHNGICFVFGCVSTLIVPFIMVYTKNISDANYNQPLFAVILSLAYIASCLSTPYKILILVTGHFKQTQLIFIGTSVLNLFISVLAVNSYGLIGVTIGTLLAMMFQTIAESLYCSKNIINRSYKHFVKHILTDILIFIVGTLCTFRLSIDELSYVSWIILAFKASIIWGTTIIIINLIFNKTTIKNILRH